MDWISIEDKLPPKGKNGFPTVIVYTEDSEVAVGFLDYCGDEWYVLHGDEDCLKSGNNVTHWMPLPEPPEGNK